MKCLALAVLLLAACGDDNEHRPGPPTGGSGGAIGSGGTGGMGGGDAGDGGGAGGADAASTTISGRVCAMARIDSTSCDTLRAGSTMSISGTSISAAVDPTTGDFTIDAPDGQSPVLLLFNKFASPFEDAVASAAVPSSFVKLRTINDQFLGNNLVPQSSGGWAMVYAIDGNGAPQQNVRVQNAAGQQVWYDDSNGGVSQAFTATGTAGLALLINVPEGTVQFDFAPPSGSPVQVVVPIKTARVSIVRIQVVP